MLTALLVAVQLHAGGIAWSEPVGGLVGGLSFAQAAPKEGVVKIIPYLHLKNVTNTIGTVDIFFDPMQRNLDLRLVDEKGDAIKVPNAGLNGRNGFVPRASWLLLPYDSTIKINVGLEGYFTPRNACLLIETDSGLLFLPKDFKGNAYVTGTFSVINPPVEPRNNTWKGKMRLPKVLVYSKGKAVVSER